MLRDYVCARNGSFLWLAMVLLPQGPGMSPLKHLFMIAAALIN